MSTGNNINDVEKYFNICASCVSRNANSENEMVRALLGSCILVNMFPMGIPKETTVEIIREECELSDYGDEEITDAISCANNRIDGCSGGLEVWKSKLSSDY